MGGKTTKLFKSSTQPSTKTQNDSNQFSFNNNDNKPADQISSTNSNTASPFVYSRRGSMYIDDDGDIAHEFYIESKEGSRVTLKRISNQFLTPQGEVQLDVPCIRNDYPVVLLDQNRAKELQKVSNN